MPGALGDSRGSSVSGTWQDRLSASAGVLYLGTLDAPYSPGTTGESRCNRDLAHRPFCSPLSYERLGSVLSTPENLSVAVQTAEASAGFGSASGALGEIQGLNLASRFLTWNFSGNSC